MTRRGRLGVDDGAVVRAVPQSDLALVLPVPADRGHLRARLAAARQPLAAGGRRLPGGDAAHVPAVERRHRRR